MSVVSRVDANELLFHFDNSNFGGNAAMSSYMLNEAQAQNMHEATPKPTIQKTQLEQFKDRLESTILNSLVKHYGDQIYDAKGNVVVGTFSAGDYSIDVQPSGADFTVMITDTASGETTTLQLPGRK